MVGVVFFDIHIDIYNESRHYSDQNACNVYVCITRICDPRNIPKISECVGILGVRIVGFQFRKYWSDGTLWCRNNGFSPTRD